MKHNSVTRHLLSLALILGMALSLVPSLAVPARGAENNPQITIIPNQFVSTPDDKEAGDSIDDLKTRFWAYQIFTGTLDPDDYVENRSINSLGGDVQWGASIQDGKKVDLLNALGNDPTPARDLGITFALMLETRGKYLNEEKKTDNGHPFKNYMDVYFNEANWQSSDDSGTEGAIGGELTSDGRIRLEAAFNEDLKTLTIGQLFTAAYDKNKDEIQALGAYTASEVIADFTPASGNVALAQAFYAIVFDRDVYGSGAPGKYTYLEENPYKQSRWIAGTNGGPGHWAIGSWDGSNINSKDNELPGGYYMIRDVYPERDKEGKANAAYMAGVFGFGSIEPKAEGPTVTKSFTNAGGNGTSFELGETVSFTLRGTLPENYYTGYEGYPYIFEDTMDEGLDFVGITRAYVRIPDNSGYIPRYDYYVVEEAAGATGGNTGKGYRLKKEPRDDGTTTVTVSFPNLKNVEGRKVTNQATWATEDVTNQIPITTGNAEIYVVYTAKLNEKANITDPDKGNLNTVKLRYANNPLWDPAAVVNGGNWDNAWDQAPTGHVTDTVRAYNFGIQLTVYGAAEPDAGGTPADDPDVLASTAVEPDTGETENRKPLAGAGFALKKGSGDDARYAILHRLKTPDYEEGDPQGRVEYTYYLTEWVLENEWYSYLSGEDTLTRTARSWGAPLEAGAKIGGFIVPSAVSPLADDPEGSDPDADGGHYAAVVTDADGVVRIVGLDNGAYVLEEVITPRGSATVDDISVRFTTTGYGADGVLTDLTAAAVNASVESAIMSGREFQGNYKIYREMVARIIVYSDPTIEVDTGGMGTALFYIGGGALLAGAALILVISNAKSKKPGKRDR